MFDAQELRSALTTLKQQVAYLDAACLSDDAATALVDVFASFVRLGSAGQAIVARRVEETSVWRRDGFRDAASWMASRTGTTVNEASTTLDTARRLESLPATEVAFRSGRLSPAQASVVSRAASADPTSEEGLLSAAATSSVKSLQDKARRVQAASASDETARYESIRRRRYFRHWTEADGAFRFDARLCPEDGAGLLAKLEPHVTRIFNEARKEGRRDAPQAYRADALVAAVHDGGGSSVPAAVHVTVDHAALVRGHVEEGETCEVAGVGPVPVATANAMLSDAILKVVVTKGADVATVCHGGRTIAASVRTALELRDPVCVVPACDIERGLEIDHRIPFAQGGPSSLDNLVRMCRWHHYLKTHRGFSLEGAPGIWRWVAPVQGHPGDDGEPSLDDPGAVASQGTLAGMPGP